MFETFEEYLTFASGRIADIIRDVQRYKDDVDADETQVRIRRLAAELAHSTRQFTEYTVQKSMGLHQ